MAVVKAQKLTYRYPGETRPAINNITLTIEKGEFVLLTGPSGCGKTTFCRCLNGLIPHFYGGELEGEIFVAGLNVKEHEIWELAQHVGMVFQNPENQLFSLSVEADVAFALENLGFPPEEIRRRVDWALNAVGIRDLRLRPPYELSGGQQQRVAIASVLAMKPEIMVLDEPTSFLDPVAASALFEIIHKLNREFRITIILVEHRLDLASKYANRVIVMNEGRIVLDAHPKEAYISEEASSVGVGIPKVVELYRLLIRNGFKLPEPPLTPEEAAEMLRRILVK